MILWTWKKMPFKYTHKETLTLTSTRSHKKEKPHQLVKFYTKTHESSDHFRVNFGIKFALHMSQLLGGETREKRGVLPCSVPLRPAVAAEYRLFHGGFQLFSVLPCFLRFLCTRVLRKFRQICDFFGAKRNEKMPTSCRGL